MSYHEIIISYKYHINIIIIWCGTRTRQRQSLGMKARSQSERGRLPATHLVIKCYCPNYSHDYLIIMIVLMTNLPRRTVRTTLTGTMGNASTATVDRGTPACNIIISYEEIVYNKGFWKYKRTSTSFKHYHLKKWFSIEYFDNLNFELLKTNLNKFQRGHHLSSWKANLGKDRLMFWTNYWR